jgi:beta-aspartyl-peptidase (threonine type)
VSICQVYYNWDMTKTAFAIHGGAGTISKQRMTPALEAEYASGLENALRTGWEILERGGSALDAVVAAVASLEDFPLFNAGRGSVFTHEGKVEMDAAVMDGRTREAGAIASVCNVQNPIRLARLVMERSDHVLLAGEGATQFAREMDVVMQPDEYFFTEHRWRQLIEARNTDRVLLDHSEAAVEAVRPVGTVGAVACDKRGNVAAGTSTGGMTNKRFGRIGDTPLIGAGTYADENCAVSCTGHGEYFMRAGTAFEVAARMRFGGSSLEDAARASVDELSRLNGQGGLIAVDRKGNIALPFNSEGMYRGSVTAGSEISVGIYAD